MSEAAVGVLTVGMAVLDRIFVVEELMDGGGKVLAHDYMEALGGIAAIAAVAVVRLGGYAAVRARIGDDAAGEALLAALREERVSTEQLVRCPGRVTPTSAVCVDGAGERQLANYLDPGLPDAAPPVQLDGIGALMLDTRWPSAAAAAATAGRARGLPVVLDYERPPDSNAAELLAGATHVAFSADGLRALISDENDPARALRRAANRCVGQVAVTLGADGVLWLAPDGEVRHVPAFDVPVLDTLGAGDVFHGALAFALATDPDCERAYRFASAAAALKCRARGARAGIPTHEEVAQLLLHGAAKPSRRD